MEVQGQAQGPRSCLLLIQLYATCQASGGKGTIESGLFGDVTPGSGIELSRDLENSDATPPWGPVEKLSLGRKRQAKHVGPRNFFPTPPLSLMAEEGFIPLQS